MSDLVHLKSKPKSILYCNKFIRKNEVQKEINLNSIKTKRKKNLNI